MPSADLPAQLREALDRVADAVAGIPTDPAQIGSRVNIVTALTRRPAPVQLHVRPNGDFEAWLTLGSFTGDDAVAAGAKLQEALELPSGSRIHFAVDSGRLVAVTANVGGDERSSWLAAEVPIAVAALHRALRSRRARPSVFLTLVVTASAGGSAPIARVGRHRRRMLRP